MCSAQDKAGYTGGCVTCIIDHCIKLLSAVQNIENGIPDKGVRRTVIYEFDLD